MPDMKTKLKKLLTILVTVILVTAISSTAVFAGSDIKIDGLYDDWKNIPKQSISYGGTNNTDISYGQLYSDGEHLYIHFKICSNYKNSAPLGNFYLKINNTELELHLFNSKDGYYSTNAPTEPGEYNKLSIGVRGGKTNWNPETLTNNVIYNAYEGKNGPEFEAKISLAKLANIYGIKKESISIITIRNNSLGKESVSIAGTSSGPVIGVLIAVAMVGLGALIAVNRKKKISEANAD